MTDRERFEQEEEERLAPAAAKSRHSKGRVIAEPHCPWRTAFQRDRDRILHAKAFRRLEHKTQVFVAPEGDHYRTRLTHTLEVSQVARTISRLLRLNEDLTEAIALGHDLGHTPFGHAGETALNNLLPGGFRHNEQSLRVVDCIERTDHDYPGLNLTWEVRDGILNHTGPVAPATQEGRIVKTADRIAYVNHDVDDAIRARIIGDADLPPRVVERLGIYYSKRIDTLVKDMIAESEEAGDIALSRPVAEVLDELRNFLFERVYIGSQAKQEQDKAVNVLRDLFRFYMEHPEEMTEEYREDGEELWVRVCDYVAGMTDGYALKKYEEYFMPRAWAEY